MSSCAGKRNKRLQAGLTVLAAALIIALVSGPRGPIATARAAGPTAEVPYVVTALKITGAKEPVYVQSEGHGKLVFSDASGAVFSIPISGGPAIKVAKISRPGGLAIAPANFGSYAGQIFVLSAAGKGGACVIDRIDKSGKVSSFATLPKAGKIGKGEPTDCRDLEFGPASGPFAGKLYAVADGNATVYETGPDGKARVFSTLDEPIPWEIINLTFAPPDDPKARGAMMLGMRPRDETAAKVGRIGMLGADGKLSANYYLVGFTRPTGWGFAPAGFGEYHNQFFILDAARTAKQSHGARDGEVLRFDKGVARKFASGFVDPDCLRFVGNQMVIADPAGNGARGGAILVIKSML
jgi:hypothetical protein